MGRGNQIGALADAAAAAEFARGTRHPANLLVALPFYARCQVEAGRLADAHLAVTESLTEAAGNENILEPIETAIAMRGLGRQAEYLDVAARTTIPSKRWDVGRAVAQGDLPRAADLLARMEFRSASRTYVCSPLSNSPPTDTYRTPRSKLNERSPFTTR